MIYLLWREYVIMSVEGLRALAQEVNLDYTDFINYRVKFWGKYKGIDLSYLNLELLPIQLFNVSDIRILNLTGNNLTYLWEKDIPNFKFLRVLRADDNPFSKIPEVIFNLENLRELYMDNCQIREIPEELDRLISLRTLSLQSNIIKEFPTFNAEIKPALQILHLDNNIITNIQLDQEFLRLLEILKLEQNSIKKFPSTLKNNRLWMLDFRGNPLKTIIPESINSSAINSLSVTIDDLDLFTNDLITSLLPINQVIIEVESELEFFELEKRILRLSRISGDEKIVYFNPTRSELIVSKLRKYKFY